MSYELGRIALDHIDVPRTRIRRDLGAIGDLAYSLGSVGILQPIQVFSVGARYRLIAGERRLQAARMLGWTEIDALVREPSGGDLLLELVENAQRKFLTDAEEADAFIRLVREEHHAAVEVAAQAGRSEAYVSKRIRVFEDAILRSAIERDELAVSLAEEFLTVPTRRRDQLVRQAIDERWDVLRVRNAIRAPRLDPELPIAPSVVPPEGSAIVRADHRTGNPAVIEGSFRTVAAESAAESAPDERRLAARSDMTPSRGRELVDQLNSVRDVISDLHWYELTPAEERALADVFDSLLRLARARQRGAKGPIFPSLKQAEHVARRRSK